MRTRVYDYLWGALPIVTSSAPGTDELLTRYDAGVIVHSASPQDFASALVNVLANEQMRVGAMRFTGEHQWTRTLQPLVDFVRAPRIDPHKEAFAATMQVPEQSRSLLDRTVSRIRRRIGGSS